MINENRITFGLGTILVSTSALRLELTHIDPSAVIGETLTKDFTDSMKVLNKAYFKNMFRLIEKLNNVSEENPLFEHEGYIFDFSTYNSKSVKAVLKGARSIISQMQLGLAC